MRILLITIALMLIIAASVSAATKVSLVTPEWVAAHANDSDVRILDVRAEPHLYFSGHVPNAVHLADNTLRGARNGLPVQYLPPETTAELLSLAGVTPQTKVVVYSDGDSVLGATMVAYALEKLGQPEVMIMDGGWSAYKASQQATQKYPSYKTGSLPARDTKSLYVTLDEVKSLIGKPGTVFVDARPQNIYAGDVNVWMRNGHIPGAINSDWHDLVQQDNQHKFKSAEEMQKILDSRGIKKDSNVILYCGTSREATLEFMAMRHLLGYPNVRLYEGSWTEYCAQPDLPVATGKEPGGKSL